MPNILPDTTTVISSGPSIWQTNTYIHVFYSEYSTRKYIDIILFVLSSICLSCFSNDGDWTGCSCSNRIHCSGGTRIVRSGDGRIDCSGIVRTVYTGCIGPVDIQFVRSARLLPELRAQAARRIKSLHCLSTKTAVQIMSSSFTGPPVPVRHRPLRCLHPQGRQSSKSRRIGCYGN